MINRTILVGRLVAVPELRYSQTGIPVCRSRLADVDENGNEKGTMCFILMRYTGLKDKNGKKIYEGDIVSYFGLKYEVLFKNGAFGWMEDGEFYSFNEMARSEFNKFEIIGNVYENPELLEGTE